LSAPGLLGPWGADTTYLFPFPSSEIIFGSVRKEGIRSVDVLNRLVLAVSLRGQVADGVIAVGLNQRRGKRRLNDPPEGIVAEVGRVAVGVGDRDQVVLGVVGVLGQIAGRVGDGDQAVGIVVGVDGRVVVLVGGGSAPSASIVAEADLNAVGIGDPGQPIHDVIGKDGGMGAAIDGIDDAGSVAACVVGVAGRQRW